MKRLLLPPLLCAASAIVCGAAEFKPPVRLMSDGAPIKVESPGYAAPCWADLKGDGKMHLLVGQFNDGKIQAFKHLNGEKFSEGEWVQAEGEVAAVPGVW